MQENLKTKHVAGHIKLLYFSERNNKELKKTPKKGLITKQMLQTDGVLRKLT